MNIPSQKIITKDNVSIDIAAVAYYKIIDPQRSVIAIEDITSAVNQISQTTVRNVVGQFSLDQLLSQTSSINLQIKTVIDGHTEPWGAEVTAVEIKPVLWKSRKIDNTEIRAVCRPELIIRRRFAEVIEAGPDKLTHHVVQIILLCKLIIRYLRPAAGAEIVRRNLDIIKSLLFI